MEEILVQNSRAYASRHQLQLAERLGFGIHGIIHVARPTVQAVLAELETLEIHMIDVSPSNIAFAD